MTVVKNLAFLDKQKLKKLSPFIESELNLYSFYPFPVDFLHHFLPFKLKFLNETFVSIENKKITGLITINKAGEKRIKINRLILGEESLRTAKMLVNCVLTMFLSKGVESFYVVINKKDSNLIKLFKEELHFQGYAKELIYKLKNNDAVLCDKEINFDHIRKARFSDAPEIKNLINNSMNTSSRPTFYKKLSDIRGGFFYSRWQYIIFDRQKNKTLGYFSIVKFKKGEYLLDFVMEKGYECYVTDIVEYTYAKLLKRKKFKSLYLKLKSYYSNFKELKEILNIQYENISENDILVKDFMVAKKQDFSYGKFVFNDATPAF